VRDERNGLRSDTLCSAMANLVFSASAAAASLAVAVLAAVKGAPAVAAVFGALAIGFVLRAAERFWSRRR
jgi:hypothetical protein